MIMMPGASSKAFEETLHYTHIQIMEIQCRTDDNYAEIFNQMIVMFGRFIHAKLGLLLLFTHWSETKTTRLEELKS